MDLENLLIQLKEQQKRLFHQFGQSIYYSGIENLDECFKKRNESITKMFSNFLPKYEASYNDFERNMPKDLKRKLIKELIFDFGLF